MYLHEKYIGDVAETYAWCLLRNHFHIIVRIKSEEEIQTAEQERRARWESREDGAPPPPQISLCPFRRFSHLFNAYAKYFNLHHERQGKLFQQSFGRKVVTSDIQFRHVIAYIHQNPQKHKFVKDFREWKYTSYHFILKDPTSSLNKAIIQNWFGDKRTFITSHADPVTELEKTVFVNDDFGNQP